MDGKQNISAQCLILELGSVICEGTDVLLLASLDAPSKVSPEQVDSMVEQIVAAVGHDARARRLLGIGHRMPPESIRLRVCCVAYLAWHELREGLHKVPIGDLADAVADKRQLSPAEALLRGRHEIGRLMADRICIGGTENSDRLACTHVGLPTHALLWLAGVYGFLTHRKLARSLKPDDGRGEDGTPSAAVKPPPTARQLFDIVRQRVIGCDPQIRMLASRISLAVARADMLARGVTDTGVGNQVLVVFGSSGTGKTFAVEEIARASNLVFSSFDASGLSGTGWAGSSVEDALKYALFVARNDAKRAARSIVCYDEIDKVLQGGHLDYRKAVQADLLRPLGGHSVIIGGKRTFDGPSTIFDCGPTCFVLSGVFEGLAELAGASGRRSVGFHSVRGEKEHANFRRALEEYGCIPEVCGRVSAFVHMPDPTEDIIAQAVVAESGIVQGFNRILAGRDINLFPQESAVDMLADYAVRSRTFFRGVKHVLGTLVEEVLFDEAKGTVMLDANLVRRAIARAGCIVPQDANDQLEGGSVAMADLEFDDQPGAAVAGG